MTTTRKRTRKGKPKDPRFYKISHLVTSSQEFLSLPLSAKQLFYTLCRLRNQLCKGYNHNLDMEFWRYERTLVQDSGLQPRTLRYARSFLVKHHFIDYQRTSPPRYKICDDVYQKQENMHRDPDALRRESLTESPLEKKTSGKI